MDDKTAQLIERLAEKLGTTAEHLWGVLVRQAPINATVSIAIWSALALIVIGVGVLGRMLIKRDDEVCDEVGWFMVIVSSVALCALCLVALVCAGDISAGFLNPEYWALRQLWK